MMTSNYQPIACGRYDQLEYWSLKKDEVEIVWKDDNETIQRLRQRIDTLITLNGIEYLRLANQTILRLDQLVAVDGLMFKGQTCGPA
ncbi:MAG: hypothetical protein HC913_08795 [Microscillaceae bacterium]|nr:hypothetical protein [Microscillaceae bacterium]